MTSVLTLEPFETETETKADFTRLDWHLADLNVLVHMAEQLKLALASAGFRRGQRLLIREASEREHKILLSQPETLRSQARLTLVGFFGQRNPDASPEARRALWDIDERLVAEVAEHPGILSLSCLELEEGNYANLVLLADREAAEHWRTSPTHHEAVHVHSPRNYLSIRIHNGTLTADQLELNKTRYYDFRALPPWLAVRDLEPPLRRALKQSGQ